MTQPQPTPEQLFAGDGELARLVRSHDWSQTPLGPIETWPQSLRTTVNLCLASNFPICLIWGPQYTQIYNDGYRINCGSRHPAGLGGNFSEFWASAWEVVGDAFNRAWSGEASFLKNQRMFLERNGYLEETFFTFSFSPIQDESGEVGGLFHPAIETTSNVLSERRTQTLQELTLRCGDARTVAAACDAIIDALKNAPMDLPCVLLYLQNETNQQVELTGSTGLSAGTPAAPMVVPLDADGPGWELAQVMQTGSTALIEDIESRFGSLPCGPYPESLQRALTMPIQLAGDAQPTGILVVGASSRLPFDDHYRTFFDLLQTGVTNAIANARTYAEERQRAEQLAELDRAKTAFFSNVSHEFRTPLTLMLGPLEETLEQPEGPQPSDRAALEMAYRNSQRLLKLVNTLLDFSRIEAGRIEAVYEPTDLATLTVDLAGVFRAAIEQAGIQLQVNCPPLSEPAYVDREMWEKIVLNLLSNAFKFTFEGEIAVSLWSAGGHIHLEVQDTGTGIPPAELPRIFERFHRVREARGRSYEGSGIGLSLVQELVKLHGGTISVDSELGQGTRFTVSIPAGSTHLPSDRIGASRTQPSTALTAVPYVEEALRWLTPKELQPSPQAVAPTATGATRQQPRAMPNRAARILVADDNADLRDYLRRLLSQQYEVDLVGDGNAALAAIADQSPDLLITDVMMPGLDGFGLLRSLRADPNTGELPVILLSARAGERARVEGLEAGADDYLVKPFSARELLARVEGALKLAQIRQEARASIQRSEARFRTIANQAPVVIWMTEADGTCSFISEGWQSLTGQAPEEAQGSGWLEPVHPDDRDRATQTLLDAHARQEGFSLDYRLQSPSGEYRWAMCAGQPRTNSAGQFIGFSGMDVSIHDRVEAEIAFREAENNYHRLFTSIDEGFCIIKVLFDRDGQPIDHRILEANPSFEQHSGIANPVGKTASDLTPGLEQDWNELYAQVIATGQSIRQEIHSDELNRWFDVLVSPLGDAQQPQVSVVFSNISDRKRAEAEREHLLQREQAAREEAERANRVKDEFLAILSHELRSPLNPILGWSKLLQTKKLDAEKTQRALSTIERNAKLQTQLIDDLLDIARILRGKLKIEETTVNLATVIEAALEVVKNSAEAKGISLQFDLMNICEVHGDEGRLQQVVWNLLSNAIKFTPEAGQVMVQLEAIDNQAQITITDTGKGIQRDFLPYVFQAFRQEDITTTRQYGGLGLGLSIVKYLVDAHGGTIAADSPGDGQGATFIVRLPLRQNQPLPQFISPSSSADLDLAGVKVLAVDDSEDARELLAMVLAQYGGKVAVAASGTEALAHLTTFQPDVLVCDIGMPNMNGYDLLRHIRALPSDQGGNVPAIAVTAFAREEDRQQALEHGFQQHLSKPVEPEQLVNAIVLSLLRRSHGSTV